MYRPCVVEISSKKVFKAYIYGAYTIRLSSHVEGPSFEFAKVLEENGNESSNILSCLFSRTLRIPVRMTPER